MSEQLWYTWSDSGFGNALGYRVRAASPNLMDISGQRTQNFINLLGYTLSQGTDLYLPPQEAPLCLAFLKAGSNQESMLIQKTYTGLDGFKRPGVFFSHLIADLPPVPSKCLGGKVPFSAREAINLWRATALWRDTDTSLRAGERNLEAIPPNDLYSGMYAGPLNEQYVMSIPELFRSVLQAFLTLALSGERKRLYLAGSPDTVAALIWGITHALPRTLTIMQELTFSTFESNIENDAKPLIVGTCWLPQYLQKGHENVPLDLPALYYQTNNPYGITINCDIPQRQTPFTLPHPLVAKYTQFVLDCFAQREGKSMIRLTMMLDKAEERNLSDVMPFLNHYVDSQEMLDRAAVTRILQELYDKIEKLMTRAVSALQQDKLPTAAEAAAASPESIKADLEMLTQDNFQRSIMQWMMQDHKWWQTQGQPLLGKLYGLTARYSKEQLAQMGNHFLHTLTASKAWSKNQGADLMGSLQLLVPDYRNYATPLDMLSAFSKGIENSLLQTQKALREALFPLASSIVDQLVQSVQADQAEATSYWSHAFKTCVDVPRIPTEVWAYLLQRLSSAIRYTNTYKELWRQFCQPSLAHLRPYVRATDNSAIASAFTTFATSAGQQLLLSIQADDAITAPFWGSVLATCAPLAIEPDVWTSLLSQLGSLAYTASYDQWREDYGKDLMKDLRAQTNQNPQSELGNAFSSFIRQLSFSLQSAIRSGPLAALSFWEKMLSSAAPASSQPTLWLDLLLNLQNALTTAGFKQWWYDRGSEVVRQLRALAADLTPFGQAVAGQLSQLLIDEAQRGTQDHEATISFLFEVLNATVSMQEIAIWLSLLHNLSAVYVYRGISWKRRSALLQHWKNIAAFQQEVPTVLAPWLEVSWDDLARLLALGLPDPWCKLAITKALETYTSSQQVLDTVKLYPKLFEHALQGLIKDYQTQPSAIRFFSFLAQQGYANSVPLLGKLLSASGYQKNIVEQLLAAAQISSNTDIVELLENHCQQMLANYELPPTMLRLIEQYFAAFDVEYLDSDPTRTLLLNLQQREKVPPLRLSPAIRQAVDGWYKIAEFLAQPQASHNSLRDLSHNLRDIKRLMEEQQTPNTAEVLKKLTAKLTPWLVKLVITEADLTRVIDNLGRESSGLQLLQDMAKTAGEQYGQERPPVRIFPYVRMILGEARALQSSQKEALIDSSFQSLFKQIETRTRDKYLPEPTWPKAFTEEWNAYLNRLRSLNLNKRLKSFKEAASKPEIPALLTAYDHLLDPYLTAEEHRLVGLATRFMEAYSSDNDAAIVQAQDALKQYYPQPLHTHEQAERIRLARQRLAQQQAFAQQQALAQQQAQAQLALAQQQAFAQPGNNGQNFTPPATVSRRSPSATSSSSERQATPATSQSIVAVVRGQTISAAWLEWALPLRKPYTTERIDAILLEMQRMENSGEDRQSKQKYKLLKQEHQAQKKIQGDEKRLREATLYDLIQDIFIQEEIAEIVQRDATAKTLFDETSSLEQINRLYNKLRVRYQHSYPPLGSKDGNTLKDLQKVFEMFVRRERFTNYLSQYRQIGLDEWWKEQLQREAAVINIDYQQVGLNPPNKGIRSRIGL